MKDVKSPTEVVTSFKKRIKALIIHDYIPPLLKSAHIILDSNQPSTAKTKKIHHWHMIFNQSHSESIHRTIKFHQHQDGTTIQTTQLNFSGFHIGNLPRAPHIRAGHYMPLTKAYNTYVPTWSDLLTRRDPMENYI